MTDLALDKLEIKTPCTEMPNSPRDMTVSVKTIAEDPENDVLAYNYTVSGGRIVGTGKNVMWDFTRVVPGSYVIVAGVDDGCGVCGKTVTKTVSVVGCDRAD